MKKVTFRAAMIGTAVVSGFLTAVSAVMDHFLSMPWLFSLAITFGTTFYHFAVRLLIGSLIPNRFDYRTFWFREKPFEKHLYRKLKLRRWKGQMPTYDPRLFSLEEYSLEQILRHTCQAEVVHEVIILFSFLPLLFSRFWGAFPVFLITSLAAAGFDTLFVLLQRYNRPRLVHLMKKQQKKGTHHV